MVRVIILLLVILILVTVARRIWQSIVQLKVGAIPDSVDIFEIPMERDRGWQVTRSVNGDVARVRAEHPDGDIEREWVVNLREPGAQQRLDNAMSVAGRIVSDKRRDERRDAREDDLRS
jgi:hypothetical protein